MNTPYPNLIANIRHNSQWSSDHQEPLCEVSDHWSTGSTEQAYAAAWNVMMDDALSTKKEEEW